MRFVRWLPLIALLAGCGSSSSADYTVGQVRQAFTRVGLHHPKVQVSPPGTIFNYGKPPHVVSVSIYSGPPPPVVFEGGPKMQVRHLGNVMVYFDVVESRTVSRALNLLK